MEGKIRILYIHHGTGIGGAPISLLNLVKQLDPKKYEAKVAFLRGGVAVEMFKEHDIDTEIIGGSMGLFGHHEKGAIQWRYFFRYVRTFIEWHKAVKTIARDYLSKHHNYSIVHLNSDVLSSWAVAAKRQNFIVVCHNRDPIAKGNLGWRRSLLRKILKQSVDRIISISEDNKKRMGLPQLTDVVYNFIPIPLFYRPSMTNTEGGFRVLYLGGSATIKGFQTAVACLPYLDDRIVLQFAGNLSQLKNERKSIKERFKYWIKLSLYRKTYKWVKVMEEAPNAEVLGLLKEPLKAIDNCDILITPFKIEHFSRPAIEAFAHGKPVIGSNVEGMDEIIDHAVNGYLVEKNNPKALADAINYLCQNPEIAREMGKKGREKAARLFSPETNTKQVESIYDVLIKSRKRIDHI